MRVRRFLVTLLSALSIVLAGGVVQPAAAGIIECLGDIEEPRREKDQYERYYMTFGGVTACSGSGATPYHEITVRLQRLIDGYWRNVDSAYFTGLAWYAPARGNELCLDTTARTYRVRVYAKVNGVQVLPYPATSGRHVIYCTLT